MNRLWLRRLALFLAPTVGGLAVLLALAARDPVPETARARVHVVDPSLDPSIRLDDSGSTSSIRTSERFQIEHGRRILELADGRGGAVTREFTTWVLRSGRLEPGGRPDRPTGSLITHDVEIEFAREPGNLAEYEELVGSPVPDVHVSARRARVEREGKIWALARLEEDVLVRARDPKGHEGRLRTDLLVVRLPTREVETDRPVVLERTGLVLRGAGLVADANLRRVEVLRDISLAIDLQEAEIPWVRSDEATDVPFVLRCDGPFGLEEIEPEEGESQRVRLRARANVEASRGPSSRLACRALDLLLAVRPGVDGGPEVLRVLRMDVEVLHPLELVAAAGDRTRIEGARLAWRRRTDEAWEATVQGSPVVVLTPPEEGGSREGGGLGLGEDTGEEIVIRCKGPAHLLVERDEGLAQAVFRDNVVVRRGEETLRASEATLVRRPGTRTITARGDVTVAGPRVRAWAKELRRVDLEDGSRRTVLSGEPRLILRGGGASFLGDGTAGSGEAETEIRSGEPLTLNEGPDEIVAAAAGGVVLERRDVAREVGRLAAKSVRLALTPGLRPEPREIVARGGVEAEATTEPGRRVHARGGILTYRAAGRTLTLEEDRPELRLVDETGTTRLRGERVVWSREMGNFEVTGPVDGEMPGTVDLLSRLGAPAEGPPTAPASLGLRAARFTGRLLEGEEGAPPRLEAAEATGDVILEGPNGVARGSRLSLATDGGGAYEAHLEGQPARVERRLPSDHVDVVEGPVLEGAGEREKGLRTIVAPRGGAAVLHLRPRDEKGSLVRLDLRSAGRVAVGDEAVNAEGGLEAEHRAWSEKTGDWGPVLRLSGRRLAGRLRPAADGKGRTIETLEILDEVRVRPPDGSELTCARASIDPGSEVIVLTGEPDIVHVHPNGRVTRAASALYRYRADLRSGTRMRFRNIRSGPPRRGGR